MHTADFAIITEDNGGGNIRYKSRCPKCGKVDESKWFGQIICVNPKGISKISGYCHACGEQFTITFYGV